MLKTAFRAAPRRILSSQSALTHTSKSSGRRLLSTGTPVNKSRSWKSSALRWGLAAAGIYYYNTSNAFAEEPEATVQRAGSPLNFMSEPTQPTIEEIVEEKRQREAQRVAEEQKRQKELESSIAKELEDGEEAGEDELEGLEDEAGQQGAFNPETGEINWECPCLGGMAHGPCGEEFKAAFSCFVYSKEEPKGVECIDKFKGMQDCFREHPEMYGSELDDDEDEVEEELRLRESEKELEDATSEPAKEPTSQTAKKVSQLSSESKSTEEPQTQAAKESSPPTLEPKPTAGDDHRNSENTTSEEAQKSGDEGGELVPKAHFDATSK